MMDLRQRSGIRRKRMDGWTIEKLCATAASPLVDSGPHVAVTPTLACASHFFTPRQHDLHTASPP